MCPESLHNYRRMGTAEHAEWVRKAEAAHVDALQSGNLPRIDNDQGYAEIFASVQSRTAGAHFMADWATASRGEHPSPPSDEAEPSTPVRATPATPQQQEPPPTPVDTSPITAANVVGRQLLVPAPVYPQYNCAENGGRGWACLAISATSVTAVVRFLNARTSDGRPYENVRLPLSQLQPLV